MQYTLAVTLVVTCKWAWRLRWCCRSPILLRNLSGPSGAKIFRVHFPRELPINSRLLAFIPTAEKRNKCMKTNKSRCINTYLVQGIELLFQGTTCFGFWKVWLSIQFRVVPTMSPVVVRSWVLMLAIGWHNYSYVHIWSQCNMEFQVTLHCNLIYCNRWILNKCINAIHTCCYTCCYM